MNRKAVAKTYCTALLVPLSLISLCSCTKGPKGLSAETYEGVKQTVAAMRRANEYRDSGTLLFEPRFLDLERAVDGIATPHVYSDITAASNTSATTIARSCVDLLRTYRRMLDLAPAPGDTGFGALPGATEALRRRAASAHLEEYIGNLNGLRKSLDDCVIELNGYL